MSRVTNAPRGEADSTSGSVDAPQAPKQRHVCPFCGTLNESAVTPCAKCTLINTPQTRRVTRGRIGPWYVLQSRNPAAPGMKYDVLVGFIRKGQVTARSIVRGPTTHQFWRYAAHVRGVSREFGLCYSCGADIHTESHLCLHCGKIQEPPTEPDVLLEINLPAGGAVKPTNDVPEMVDAEVVRSEESIAGVNIADATKSPRVTRVAIEPMVEPVPDIVAEREASKRPSPTERAQQAAASVPPVVEDPDVAEAEPAAIRSDTSERVTITIDSAPEPEPIVTPDTFAKTPVTEAHSNTAVMFESAAVSKPAPATPAPEPRFVRPASSPAAVKAPSIAPSKADPIPLEPAEPAEAQPADDFTATFHTTDVADSDIDATAGTPFAAEQVGNYASPASAQSTTSSELMSPNDVETWFHSHFAPVAEFNQPQTRQRTVSVHSPRFWSTTFMVGLTIAVGVATSSVYFPAEREKAAGWMNVHFSTVKQWVSQQYASYMG